MTVKYWRIAVVLIVLLLFTSTLVWVPKWQVPATGLTVKERIEAEDSARKTIAQILGGGFFLLTAYFTWRTVSATEKSVRIAQENLRVSSETQLTDRFSKAIEQLGNESLQVRLGAIYSLERISRDSERDHWPIMEVLTAYVREKTRWEEGRPMPKTFPLDIQAVLTVFGRNPTVDKEQRRCLNLGNTDLRKADLRGFQMPLVSFREAHFDEALLMDANFNGVDFTGAQGTHTQFHSSQMERANFFCAELPGAWFAGANLKRALFPSARIKGAHLQRANLSEASLGVTNLAEAEMQDADLTGANLKNADLREAKGLTQAQLDSAIVDSETKVSPPFRV